MSSFNENYLKMPTVGYSMLADKEALNGPAIIRYDQPLIWNGFELVPEGERKVIEEAYVQNGYFHRLDGPSSPSLSSKPLR